MRAAHRCAVHRSEIHEGRLGLGDCPEHCRTEDQRKDHADEKDGEQDLGNHCEAGGDARKSKHPEDHGQDSAD